MNHHVSWKNLAITTGESLLTFYLATFCLAIFFTHHGTDWFITSCCLIFLYIFIILACAKRILEKLSLASIMLIIPIAPLLALILVISLIPIIEKL